MYLWSIRITQVNSFLLHALGITPTVCRGKQLTHWCIFVHEMLQKLLFPTKYMYLMFLEIGSRIQFSKHYRFSPITEAIFISCTTVPVTGQLWQVADSLAGSLFFMKPLAKHRHRSNISSVLLIQLFKWCFWFLYRVSRFF